MNMKFHCDENLEFRCQSDLVHGYVYKDYQFEAHYHDFYELNIVMRGKGTHQIENSCLQVKAGDVFMIPPMVVHAYYDTESLDVHHVLFHRTFILNNQREAVGKPGYLQFVEIEPFLRSHLSKASFLHLSQKQLQQLAFDLEFLERDGPFDRDAYWLSFLLSDQIHSDNKKNVNPYEYAIIHALEFIHLNFSKKITIETLLQEVFLSRSTFLRNFYSICGCTPIQYLNHYRCKRAQEMLESTAFSKTAIAQECGFFDLSHMERMMKKHYSSI